MKRYQYFAKIFKFLSYTSINGKYITCIVALFLGVRLTLNTYGENVTAFYVWLVVSIGLVSLG